MRAIIIDDHEVVRRGIILLLEAAGGIAVCGDAGTVAEAGPLAASTDSDVAIVDLKLGDGSGVTAARAVRSASPRTYVLLLTAAADNDARLAAVLAGASGYVLKQVQGNHIVAAVRDVAAGRRLLDPADADAAVHQALLRQGASALSQDEAHLLVAVAAGRSDRQIAAQRGLSEAQAVAALAALLSKLGLGGTGRSVPRSRHVHS